MTVRILPTLPLLLACSSDLPELVPCSADVSPEPALVGYVLDAADRIRAASGCEVSIVAGGVPISYGPARLDDGRPACGATRVAYSEEDMVIQSVGPVAIDSETCPETVGLTVTHELIHVLMDYPGHFWFGDIHAESGVFASPAVDDLIDTGTLTTLCGQVRCTAFAPER